MMKLRVHNTLALSLLLVCGLVSSTTAQHRPRHLLYRADLPPGTVGRQQVAHHAELAGYYQPVRFQVPKGTSVSPATGGSFEQLGESQLTVGLLIGEVYRFRVTGIPRHEGRELFPTVEVIDRLHPPPGQRTRFPIPIELTVEEMTMALRGKMVTRVIYLEDPQHAMPVAENSKTGQRYFEALPGEDPLKAADELGRPMAIFRMGSRVPDHDGPNDAFLFGSPRWELCHIDAASTTNTSTQPRTPRSTNTNQQTIDPIRNDHYRSGRPRGLR